jgi:serpin B
MRRILLCALVGSLSVAYGSEPVPAPLVEGNTRFALELYKHLAEEAGNIFFSPYSISAALGMTSAGARGDTLKEIDQVFHFPEGGPHRGFRDLDKILIGPSKPYELNIANRLWLKKGRDFRPEFVKTLADHYGAGAERLDFAGSPEPSRLTINRWISDRTKTKIPELISKGMINEMTEAVLTNAIYFKGLWASQFKKFDTKKEPFHLEGGKSVPVDLMRQEESFLYREDENAQILELPYKGDDMSMVVILPREGVPLAAVEKGLTASTIDEWVNHIYPQEVQVFLPAFKTRYKKSLPGTLKVMGMPLAFNSNRADFSGIRELTPGENLSVSDVIHEAFVQVDEEGTEAAAATAVGIMLTSAAVPPPIFRADRPFLFLIRHRPTGTILFMGRLIKPQE